MKQPVHMKTRIIGKILVGLGLVFVLGSAITQVHAEDQNLLVVTIHSTGDVTRGKTGVFVLNMKPALMLGGIYVKFTVSGTAVPGVDYVHLVAPAHIGPSGYAALLVQTLPNRTGSIRSCSVVVTLEPGPGYAVGDPKSAQMTIEPPVLANW
jgi:hypothetical protein